MQVVARDVVESTVYESKSESESGRFESEPGRSESESGRSESESESGLSESKSQSESGPLGFTSESECNCACNEVFSRQLNIQ